MTVLSILKNTDLEIGVSVIYLHLLSYFDTHTNVYALAQLAHFTRYASTFLKKNDLKVITERS